MNKKLSKKTIKKILNDPILRKELTRTSHYWFFHIYLNQYVKYPTADFQKEIFQISENGAIKNAVICAFRGSSKSTLMTLSFPIFSILGSPQKKFVLILSQTQQQARLHLTNIRRELEANEILRKDLGPFRQETDEWGSTSLVIPNQGARITAASSEQSIRGIRHGAYRPDLILADDVEDSTSVKTKEGRDKTYDWLTSEVIPCGDVNTRMIVVGNLLHEDSLLMRLRKLIDEGKLTGTFRAYPLIDDNDDVLWPAKFPSMEEIEDLKKTVGSEKAWQREYLLRIITDEDQVVKPEWIHYYDELPSLERSELRYIATGIDLAISQKQSADYTAMVSARVHGYEEEMKVYILPNPVNERLDFPAALERAKALSKALSGGSHTTELYIEEVGYQTALIEELKRQNYHAEGVKVAGQDKRSRLNLLTSMIQNGQVLFPRVGAEDLITQLTGFGLEKFDDLADAFAILLFKVMEKNDSQPRIFFISGGRRDFWDQYSVKLSDDGNRLRDNDDDW